MCRYEWKHRGSTHIHGFLWIDGAPNMETLDWKDPDQINDAKKFFDSYVTAWNQRENKDTHIHMHQHIEDDPCLLDTKYILLSNPLQEYEQLLQNVQSALKIHVYVEKGLHMNIDIKSSRTYNRNNHSTLMKRVKKHITMHTMILI